MRALKQSWSVMVLLLCVGVGSATAQNAAAPAAKPDAQLQPPANLIEATKLYKASSRALLALQESEVSDATTRLAELRLLVDQGLVAKSELENSEAGLAALRAQVAATQKQITDADNMIAEIRAEEDLAKGSRAQLVSKQYVTFANSSSLIRYNGKTHWSLGGLDEVQGFFAAKFGYSLPTSAIGQSATHNRLGYDHRNAVDVALHPDSLAGKTLINYLQTQGIPFLAFRGAIPGVATGPHIHIGSASHRLS